MNKVEIIERSSGWYLVDDVGVVAGPFERFAEAQMWLNKSFKRS